MSCCFSCIFILIVPYSSWRPFCGRSRPSLGSPADSCRWCREMSKKRMKEASTSKSMKQSFGCQIRHPSLVMNPFRVLFISFLMNSMVSNLFATGKSYVSHTVYCLQSCHTNLNSQQWSIGSWKRWFRWRHQTTRWVNPFFSSRLIIRGTLLCKQMRDVVWGLKS